jgi:hypothetical protein
MRAIRIVAVSVAAAIAAVLLFPAFLAVRSQGSMVFEPERMDYALLALAALLVAIGAQVAAWRRYTYVSILALLAGAALLFGSFAIFSIGLAVLPAGVVFMLLLYRALRHMPSTSRAPAALGGALAGFGAVFLYLALIIPATVECRLNGGATSSGRWHVGSQQTFSGATVGSDGVMTGRIETPTSIATYRCEQGRIVEFRRDER